jgi:hypothetical protein
MLRNRFFVARGHPQVGRHPPLRQLGLAADAVLAAKGSTTSRGDGIIAT